MLKSCGHTETVQTGIRGRDANRNIVWRSPSDNKWIDEICHSFFFIQTANGQTETVQTGIRLDCYSCYFIQTATVRRRPCRPGYDWIAIHFSPYKLPTVRRRPCRPGHGLDYYSCCFIQTADGQTETVQTGIRLGLLSMLLHVNSLRSDGDRTDRDKM